MNPRRRPGGEDRTCDVKVAESDDGVTFREVGSANAWIFVSDERDLTSVEA